MLHEAAHALAQVRGIKDTSRRGRWHNARFRALAEELRIEVRKEDRNTFDRPAAPYRIRPRSNPSESGLSATAYAEVVRMSACGSRAVALRAMS
jgi:hypothetical protein